MKEMADGAVLGSQTSTEPIKVVQAKKLTTAEMVYHALIDLHERKGSSLKSIVKYMEANYLFDYKKKAFLIKRYLKGAVESGIVTQVKGKGASGSFKLPNDSQFLQEKKKAAVKLKYKEKKMLAAKNETSKKAQKEMDVNVGENLEMDIEEGKVKPRVGSKKKTTKKPSDTLSPSKVTKTVNDKKKAKPKPQAKAEAKPKAKPKAKAPAMVVLSEDASEEVQTEKKKPAAAKAKKVAPKVVAAKSPAKKITTTPKKAKPKKTPPKKKDAVIENNTPELPKKNKKSPAKPKAKAAKFKQIK